MCVWVHTCSYMFVYERACMHACLCLCECVFVCVCLFVCLFVCLRTLSSTFISLFDLNCTYESRAVLQSFKCMQREAKINTVSTVLMTASPTIVTSVCVCVHVCVHACPHMCLHVSVKVLTYNCMLVIVYENRVVCKLLYLFMYCQTKLQCRMYCTNECSSLPWYIWMCACVREYMYAWAHMCLHTSVKVCTSTRACVYPCVRTCVCVRICVRKSVQACVYMRFNVRAHMCMYMRVHVRMCTCICTCVLVCVCERQFVCMRALVTAYTNLYTCTCVWELWICNSL
jgi:hypothetical protein